MHIETLSSAEAYIFYVRCNIRLLCSYRLRLYSYLLPVIYNLPIVFLDNSFSDSLLTQFYYGSIV